MIEAPGYRSKAPTASAMRSAPNFARIVVQDRHTRLRAGSDHGEIEFGNQRWPCAATGCHRRRRGTDRHRRDGRSKNPALLDPVVGQHQSQCSSGSVGNRRDSPVIRKPMFATSPRKTIASGASRPASPKKSKRVSVLPTSIAKSMGYLSPILSGPLSRSRRPRRARPPTPDALRFHRHAGNQGRRIDDLGVSDLLPRPRAWF